MGVSDGWVEIGDRVFVRRYAFYDQNIGVVLGRAEALVIDTRSTYAQAREIQDRPARADRLTGRRRRRHARPLRPRLRQRHLPTGDDLGSRALRHVHGPHRRGAQADHRGRGARPRRRPRGDRHRPARPRVRDPRPDRGRRARGRCCATSAAATPTTTSSSRFPGTDVVFAGDLLENGNVPFFGDAYPLDWPGDRRGARGPRGPGRRGRRCPATATMAVGRSSMPTWHR